MKKIISLVMAFVFVVSMSTAIYATEVEPEKMNMEQLQVAASYFFWTDVSTNVSEWETNNSFDYPIPLYSLEDELIAYYIKTLDENGEVNGYMIVNAFWDNPCVLEYGYGSSAGEKIDEYLLDGQKVYYNLAGEFFTEQDQNIYMASKNDKTFTKNRANTNDEVIDLVEILSVPDHALKSTINAFYEEHERNSVSRSGANGYPNWNILGLNYMPSGRYSSGNLPYVGSTSWAIMSQGDYNNSCGPTSGTNMLIYYGKKLGVTFVTNKGNTINSLYDYMGTDDWGLGDWGTSAAGYTSGLKAYVNANFSNRTVTTNTYSTYSWTSVKSNITNGYMVAAYLEHPNGLTSGGAHYVNYVGWRNYEDNGANYIRIITQWDASDDFYVLHNSAYTAREKRVIRVNVT